MRVLDRIEDIILITMFAIMVAAIFSQVIMRYVFSNPLPWSEELGKFLFVWISWIGISIGQRRGEHIKIEMLLAKLPFRLAMICNILSDIIVMVICGVTAYYGVVLMINQVNTSYAGIGFSISWGYFAVTFGCSIMVLRCVATIIQSIKDIKRGERSGGGIESSTEFVVVE